GAAWERVRLAAEPVRAEDRERDGLARFGRDAQRVHRTQLELRPFPQPLEERDVACAAAGDDELLPRTSVERAPDRLDRERGRGRDRVVERAAGVLHVGEELCRERRAELLAAGGPGSLTREVRVRERLRERRFDDPAARR